LHFDGLNYKTILLTFMTAILFLGCSTARPPALPEAYAQKLPWGAIDLDVDSTKKLSIKNSLGSVLTQRQIGIVVVTGVSLLTS